MGLTGIVLSLRLRLIPIESAFVSVDYDRAADLDETLRLFHESDEDYRYSVAWVDGMAGGATLGRSLLMRGNPAPKGGGRELVVKEGRGVAVPGVVPGFLLNRWSARAFNALYYRRRPVALRGVLQHYEPFFFPLDGLREWNRLYGGSGFVQYQCILPYEGGRDALAAMLELVRRQTPGSFLTVLKRFGPAEPEQLLSFPMAGYTLAMDIAWRGRAVAETLARLDEIVLMNGGRVYLAKDARLRAESLRPMYPRLDEWLEVRARVDPNERLHSDLSRRLRLTR
jgi:decaprenylphospho-beta-D-ribofuranose 2-oxidase